MSRVHHGACLLLSAFVLLAVGPAWAADPVLDSVMYSDPKVPAAQVVKVFPPRLLPLWLAALERPEDDLKCQAAAAIALARKREMPSLAAAVSPLVRSEEHTSELQS